LNEKKGRTEWLFVAEEEVPMEGSRMGSDGLLLVSRGGLLYSSMGVWRGIV
jgi:hypothetical protein